jgi:hypothetical protein
MSKIIHTTKIVSKLLHNSKMPAFTLYGSRGSTNTDRVRLTLAEGGFTDYELVLLNLQKGEQKVGDPFSYLLTCHIFALLSITFDSEAKTIEPSPRNTRNVTRGVKYQQ